MRQSLARNPHWEGANAETPDRPRFGEAHNGRRLPTRCLTKLRKEQPSSHIHPTVLCYLFCHFMTTSCTTLHGGHRTVIFRYFWRIIVLIFHCIASSISEGVGWSSSWSFWSFTIIRRALKSRGNLPRLCVEWRSPFTHWVRAALAHPGQRLRSAGVTVAVIRGGGRCSI